MTAAVDRLDESLAAATPDLDDEGRRLALAVFRRLSTGEPARVDDLAAETGLSLDAAEERLSAWHGVFRDARGDVVGFWGIAVAEMEHRLRVGDGPACTPGAPVTRCSSPRSSATPRSRPTTRSRG